jgi:hypothetical protein
LQEGRIQIEAVTAKITAMKLNQEQAIARIQ